jgi:FMN phosphatase YigB (HAD superfamily)
MIGDNYDADICGATTAGLDHVYFNPEKAVHAYDIQTEIHSLYQLKDIL